MYSSHITAHCVAGAERQGVNAQAVTGLLQATRNTIHALGHVVEDQAVEKMQRMLEVEGMSMLQVPPL